MIAKCRLAAADGHSATSNFRSLGVDLRPAPVFNQDSELRFTWINSHILAWAKDDCLGKTDAEIAGGEEGARQGLTCAATDITSAKESLLERERLITQLQDALIPAVSRLIRRGKA